jgi:photosystem II stability/assembly factor-like uncharacterized protein
MKSKFILLFSLNVILFNVGHSQTWTTLTSQTTQNLWGVSFVDANTGYVCGDSGTILKTTNGGTTWTPLNSGTKHQFAEIYFFDANTGFVGSWMDAGGIIYKTTNGGTSWTNVSLNVGGAHLGGSWFFVT